MRRAGLAFAASVIAVLGSSWALFGSPFIALFVPVLAGRYVDALGPWGHAFLAAAAVVSLVWAAFVVGVAWDDSSVLVPAIILACSILIAYGLIIRITEARRDVIVAAFEAECVALTPLSRSLHIAPREWQFDLHGSAVKDGVPYAWSWREMSFYRLRDTTWPNVLPLAIARCVSDERSAAARELRGG